MKVRYSPLITMKGAKRRYIWKDYVMLSHEKLLDSKEYINQRKFIDLQFDMSSNFKRERHSPLSSNLSFIVVLKLEEEEKGELTSMIDVEKLIYCNDDLVEVLKKKWDINNLTQLIFADIATFASNELYGLLQCFLLLKSFMDLH
ncbi:hypothetical protein Goari_027018 [Gossypium aridum]|uniref:Uncharacterized protein n=1 Tax=Gossypium aridum TaxID=34290 RepID=A0A7J8YLI6_GOSAI|nr:hypothetical protein [Gossypium aridum]